MNSKLVQEIAEYRRKSRMITWTLSLIIIGTIAIGVTLLWKDAGNLVKSGPKQNLFLTTLSENMRLQALPKLQSRGQQLAAELQPVAEKEMQDFLGDLPKLEKTVLAETRILLENIRNKAEPRFNKLVSEVMEKNGTNLQAMLPDDKVAQAHQAWSELSVLINSNLNQRVDAMTKPHAVAIESIMVSLEKIRVSETNPPPVRSADLIGIAVDLSEQFKVGAVKTLQ
jgi:hypothetical protein